MSKIYGFLSIARNISNKCRKKLLSTTTETGLNAQKTASKKYSIKQLTQHENSHEKKPGTKTVKSKHVPDEDSRKVEETVITPKKRKEMLKITP